MSLRGLDMVRYPMECGIYPERPFFYVKIGMILIGSKRIQEDPELFSLHFTGWWDTASLGSWGEGMGGVAVDNFLLLPLFCQMMYITTANR